MRNDDEGADPHSALAWSRWLTPTIALFLILSVALAVVPVPLVLSLLLNAAAAVLVIGLAAEFALRGAATAVLRGAIALLGAAYAGYFLYVIGTQAGDLLTGGAAWDSALALDGGDNPLVLAQFAGEALAMGWTVALFWAIGPFAPPGAGRTAWSWPRALIAAIPALLIAIAPLFETWMQGVFAEMSLGFALWLPPPVYALAAFCYVYALLTCWDGRLDQAIPWRRELRAGLLLLPVAGFTLLSNYQLTMAILVLLLLTGRVRPLSSQPVTANLTTETQRTRSVG